jgi:hypothetical protein
MAFFFAPCPVSRAVFVLLVERAKSGSNIYKSKESFLMKKFRLITKFTAFLLLFAATVMAGDLRNEDGRRYEVKVHESSTTRNTWIEPNTTMMSICSNCEIEVVGVGRIKISGSERAVIKNGKLVKQ